MSALLVEAAPPGELTEAGARLRTDRLRGRLETAWAELQFLLERRAWAVLGYESPADWLQAEFGDLRLVRITREQRADIVGAMRSQGMSVRAISRALGVSVGTVHGHTAPVIELPAPVEVSQQPKTDRVVALIAAQGDRGMTCLELELETGWRHGVASGPLSAVAKRGRVRATGRFRSGYGVYQAV